MLQCFTGTFAPLGKADACSLRAGLPLNTVSFNQEQDAFLNPLNGRPSRQHSPQLAGLPLDTINSVAQDCLSPTPSPAGCTHDGPSTSERVNRRLPFQNVPTSQTAENRTHHPRVWGLSNPLGPQSQLRLANLVLPDTGGGLRTPGGRDRLQYTSQGSQVTAGLVTSWQRDAQPWSSAVRTKQASLFVPSASLFNSGDGIPEPLHAPSSIFRSIAPNNSNQHDTLDLHLALARSVHGRLASDLQVTPVK